MEIPVHFHASNDGRISPYTEKTLVFVLVALIIIIIIIIIITTATTTTTMIMMMICNRGQDKNVRYTK
jgi:flagellar basal body-associated protein FliL